MDNRKTDTGAPSTGGGAASEPIAGQPDLTPRVRDAEQNRKGATFPLSHPLVDNTPVEQTPLERALAVIEGSLPAWANWLRFKHDHERLHLQKVARFVGEREERRQREANARAAAHNARVVERVAAVRRDAADARGRLQGMLSNSSAQLVDAESQARTSLGEICAPYDPQDLSERAVIRPSGATIRGTAASLNLHTPGGADSLYMPLWMGHFCSGVVGLLIGVSLLVVSHVAHPDTIGRHPVTAVIGAVVGYGLSLCSRFSTRLFWARVGQLNVVPRPPARWLRAIAVASVGTALVLGADMALEERGLLALARIQNSMDALGSYSRGTGSQADNSDAALFLCVAFVVTGAYVLYAALEGYLKGRDAETIGMAGGHLEATERNLDRSQRATPDVRTAQSDLSGVRLLRHRIHDLEARLAENDRAEKIAVEALEASLLAEDTPVSEEGKKLVQDANDDARSSGVSFTEEFKEALAAVEPHPESSQRRGLLRARR